MLFCMCANLIFGKLWSQSPWWAPYGSQRPQIGNRSFNRRYPNWPVKEELMRLEMQLESMLGSYSILVSLTSLMLDTYLDVAAKSFVYYKLTLFSTCTVNKTIGVLGHHKHPEQQIPPSAAADWFFSFYANVDYMSAFMVRLCSYCCPSISVGDRVICQLLFFSSQKETSLRKWQRAFRSVAMWEEYQRHLLPSVKSFLILESIKAQLLTVGT